MTENNKIAKALLFAKPMVPSADQLSNVQQYQITHLKNYSKVRNSFDPLVRSAKRAALMTG